MEDQDRTPLDDQSSSADHATEAPTGPQGPVPAPSPPKGGLSPTCPSTSAVSVVKPGGRSLRPFRVGATQAIGSAITELRNTRKMLRGVGAKRAAAAVARALKSAEGAQRHAERIEIAPIPWTPGLCRQRTIAQGGFGLVRRLVAVV